MDLAKFTPRRNIAFIYAYRRDLVLSLRYLHRVARIVELDVKIHCHWIRMLGKTLRL